MPTNDESSENGGGAQPPSYPLPERELIVVAEPSAKLRVGLAEVSSLADTDVEPLNSFLSQENLHLELLFGATEERLEAEATTLSAATGASTADLTVFYRVRAQDERLEDLARSLSALPGVHQAYVKPAVELPVSRSAGAVLERPESLQRGEAPPALTPDFSARQGYLQPAPNGVDALYAATLPGGAGAAVGIIDIEGAWNFSHEDLAQNQGGVVGGTPTTDLSWRNHGTAVVGVIGGDQNSIGVTGIAPAANVRAISIFGGLSTGAAIHQAANLLQPGDVILIELHRPGPRYDFQSRDDQSGYIAIEWWPDDFAAIQYATNKGIVVVEAGGNGGENLDDPLYDKPAAGFPATWKNPFNVANPSSLAVLVGAGAPPPGTHGADYGPDRSRLDFSNYGARIDTQGWGREVTTTGGRHYSPGDLQSGAENLWYTDSFSGTSSASPIIVGSIACIQGHLRAAGQPVLTPMRAIQLLRETGSPQQDAPGRPATQRIGNRPDIRAAIAKLVKPAVRSGVATQFWDEQLAYPQGTAASLWLFVDDAWHKRDSATVHERDSVQRAFAAEGRSEVRVWYQDVEIVGLVVRSI